MFRTKDSPVTYFQLTSQWDYKSSIAKDSIIQWKPDIQGKYCVKSAISYIGKMFVCCLSTEP